MKQSIVSFILTLLFLSCKKSESPDILTEKTNFLTAGVWHLTGYESRGIISTDIIQYADLPACKQDDLRSFNKNGTGELNEGTTKCNSTDPQSIAVQWKFLNGLANSLDINGTIYIVSKLDNTTLAIYISRTNQNAQERNYVYSR